MNKGVKLLFSFIFLAVMAGSALLGLGRIDPNPNVAMPVTDGETLHLFLGTTDYIIKEALRGAAGTGRMVKDTFVLLYAPLQDAVAFVVFDAKNTAFISDIAKLTGGQCINCDTFERFVAWMVDNGWKPIPAKGVADVAWAKILDIAGKTSSMPVFVFVLAGSFDIAPQIIATYVPRVDS